MTELGRAADYFMPPNPVQIELMKAGAINPAKVRMPALQRCRCGHVPGAHDEDGCFARGCSCPKLELAFDYSGDFATGVSVVRMKLNPDGTLEKASGPPQVSAPDPGPASSG